LCFGYNETKKIVEKEQIEKLLENNNNNNSCRMDVV